MSVQNRRLDDSFWSFEYRAAFQIKNRCLDSAHGTTPFEKLFDKTPDVSHFQVFECQSFMFSEKLKRNKIECKALEGLLLSFSNNSTSYLIGFVDGTELITKNSRNIHINQTSCPGRTQFANTEIDSEIFFESNGRGSEIELRSTDSVPDTNLIINVSELQNDDSVGNSEALAIER